VPPGDGVSGVAGLRVERNAALARLWLLGATCPWPALRLPPVAYLEAFEATGAWPHLAEVRPHRRGSDPRSGTSVGPAHAIPSSPLVLFPGNAPQQDPDLWIYNLHFESEPHLRHPCLPLLPSFLRPQVELPHCEVAAPTARQGLRRLIHSPHAPVPRPSSLVPANAQTPRARPFVQLLRCIFYVEVRNGKYLDIHIYIYIHSQVDVINVISIYISLCFTFDNNHSNLQIISINASAHGLTPTAPQRPGRTGPKG